MRKLLLALALVTIIISSCKKDPKGNDIQTEDKTMTELTIDDQFNWKTTNSINVTLTSSSDNTVYIKSEDGDIYLKSFLKSGQKLETKITIPSYENEVVLIFNNQNIKVSVAGNNLEYNFI